MDIDIQALVIVLSSVAVALIQVINQITPHWSSVKGLGKVLLFITEFLSVFNSANNRDKGELKLPFKVKKDDTEKVN